MERTEHKNKKSKQINYTGIFEKGFGKLSKQVILTPHISINAKAIYAYLTSSVLKDGYAYPSLTQMAFHLHTTKDTLIKYIDELKQKELIKIEKCFGFTTSHKYSIVKEPKKNINVYSDGYGAIPRKLVRDFTIDCKAKALYAYFAVFAAKTGKAFPKLSNILYHLQITRNTYYKYRKQLIDKGYISVEYHKQNGRFANNVYYLNEYPEEIQVEKTNLRRYINENTRSELNTTQLNSIQSKENNCGLSTSQAQQNAAEKLTEHKLESICIDTIKNTLYGQKLDLALSLTQLVSDTIAANSRTVRISKQNIHINLVRKRFAKLTAEHIINLVNALDNIDTTNIILMKAYLLTCLWNAPDTAFDKYKKSNNTQQSYNIDDFEKFELNYAGTQGASEPKQSYNLDDFDKLAYNYISPDDISK